MSKFLQLPSKHLVLRCFKWWYQNHHQFWKWNFFLLFHWNSTQVQNQFLKMTISITIHHHTMFYIPLNGEFYGELEYVTFISGWPSVRWAAPSPIIFSQSMRWAILPQSWFHWGGSLPLDGATSWDGTLTQKSTHLRKIFTLNLLTLNLPTLNLLTLNLPTFRPLRNFQALDSTLKYWLESIDVL